MVEETAGKKATAPANPKFVKSVGASLEGTSSRVEDVEGNSVSAILEKNTFVGVETRRWPEPIGIPHNANTKTRGL